MADDVLIVGKLDSKELTDSIDKLVNEVANKSTAMAITFEQAMNKMSESMKNFAITQRVSVTLMKEAWKDMSASFDAMFKAQSEGTGGGKGRGKAEAEEGTVRWLEEQSRLQKEIVRDQKIGSAELQIEVDKHAKINEQLKEELKSTKQIKEENAKKALKNLLTLPQNDLKEAEYKLRALLHLSANYQGKGIFSQEQWNRLNNAIAKTQQQIDKLQEKKPKSLKDVLGMDESSLEAITAKMRALKRVQIDPNNAEQVKKLGDEYQKLKRRQAELMGQNIQMTHSNNYLAQSFGYIRNRIVYALTLGAVTNFTKQIYEVRGQYELLERSLGILIDNMRRGSEIFNELNAMALKSPFTLMELATGAKQLMAYNFAEDEVVETTRRLADISSALGVPMERLVYNLGQIRAQTVLTARDARDFANAGLAIVPMLADLYTKQKKFGDEIVTTSQVYDMMSNKMVSYADVMKVINSITDEGGKFFDFQAKQAETMKVQMNNLTLAWNNMLNEIGKNNQELLTAPLKGLKLLFENWQMLEKAIRAAIVAMGLYYTRATLVSLINGTLITQSAIRAGYLLANGFNAAKNALIGLRTVMITNPFGALALAISTAIGYMAIFNDSVNEMTEYNNRFGESGGSVVRDVEALYGSIESLDKESATYKKVVAELNQILGDFNLAQIDEKSNIDEILKSREKNIQLIKEEILERKHLNDLQQGRDTYDDEVKKARERLRSNLSNAITENFFGIGTINEEIAKNAPALTNIISDIIESNIELVANKTGDEYEKGVETIFAKIQERLKNNKALGLSEETINSSWLENNFFRFYKSNIISNVINDLKDAKEANDQYNESVNENYEAEKRAAEQGATFNDRVEQTSDSLLKAANDTDKFYGKINQLIKDYSGQNIIDFLVRVNAQVPEWMAKMNVTELTRLSARFAALASQAKKAGKEGLLVGDTYFTTQQLYERAAQYASAVKQKQADTEARKSTTITKEASEALKDYKQSIEAVRVAKNRLKQGTADQTLVTEKEAEAQKKYNAALQKGVSLEDLKKAKDGKQTKTQKNPLGDALQKEIQLINDIQRTYKEYRKAGVDAETAKTAAANEYTKSLQTQNAQLKRFGIKGLTGEQLATMDLREIRDYYQGMLDIASKLKNVKGVEALEKALRGINVEITKLDYKKITDGLNSELGKIKDEYELAIELDANPELGNMFLDMFDINVDELPRSIDEYAERVVERMNGVLKNENIQLPHLNLTDDDLKAFKDMMYDDTLSEAAYNIIEKKTLEIREMRQKDAKDTVQKARELQYKLSDVNGKIALEKEKLAFLEQKLAKETDAEKRKLLEYQIEDEKNTISSLEETVLQMLPTYKNVFNSIVEHSSIVTRRIAKQWREALINAKKNNDGTYTVTDPQSGEKASLSQKEFGKQLDKVDGQLRSVQTNATKLREAFTKGKDGTIDFAKGFEILGTVVAANLKSLAELRDNLKETFGWDLGDSINAAIDGFAKMSDGISGVISSAKSGDIFGVVNGAVNIFAGLGDGIASLFGDGAARTKRLQREIEESEEAVRRLNMAYKELERTVSDAMGAEELRARRSEIANKQAELAEIRRQMELEKSKRSKDRDDDKIKEYEERIQDLQHDIEDLATDITTTLLGSNIKNAAESFVSTWVDAWRQGGDVLGALSSSFDDMIDTMIAKSIASRLVANRLQGIWDVVDQITKDNSEGGADVTMNELRRIKNLIGDKSIGEAINQDLQRLYEALGIAYGVDSTSEKKLSALQQGIQSITEDTAGAIEGYMNGVSQQVYLQSDILTEIRDMMTNYDLDVQVATMSQILLQLQQSYSVQMAIQGILEGWSAPDGLSVRVQMQ